MPAAIPLNFEFLKGKTKSSKEPAPPLAIIGIATLFDINLIVKENEKILLVGANGAGKSTLIRVLAGVHMTRNYQEFNVLEFHIEKSDSKTQV